MKKYYQLEQDENARSAELTIYGDITSWPFSESDVSAYNLSQELKELDVDTIDVRINSYGGEVAEGLAIYNQLKQSKAHVTTHCDGFACSIASVVFMAGDERVMSDPSLLMIHNAWTYASGDSAALRKQADDLETITEASKRIYLAATDMDEAELAEWMDSETWIDAQTALEHGFATSIEDAAGQHASQSAARTIMRNVLDAQKRKAKPAANVDVHMALVDADEIMDAINGLRDDLMANKDYRNGPAKASQANDGDDTQPKQKRQAQQEPQTQQEQHGDGSFLARLRRM